MLVVKDVSYRYSKQNAVEGVTFQVGEGQIYGFLGPNGSGKSTLFRILSTLVMPHAGSVQFFGGAPTSIREVRRSLGVLFQSPALDKKLTARENWRHYARLFGFKRKRFDEVIGSLVRELDLHSVAERIVEKLSGGFQRRVELAKVLITNPKLLILDEPTTGLDPLARETFWRCIGKRVKEGVSVVFSTHQFDEGSLCDRVLLLSRGRSVAEGIPARLTEELGGELLKIDSPRAVELQRELRRRFDLPAIIRGERVFADVSQVRGKLAAIYDFLVNERLLLTLGKPTLADLFFLKTETG